MADAVPLTPPLQSAWTPLRRPVFRALWLATVASGVGTWMHDTAAAWLMTSLTTSTLMVALMQTATSLPVLFLALPAGALADIVDRRRLLLITQSWMLGAAAVLGLLTVSGAMTPWLLLFLTFNLGLGVALNTPAWQATTPDLVPPSELTEAVALNGIATNIARAIGPAIGGLLVAAIGSGGVFLLNAASFVAVVLVLRAWRKEPRETVLPAERVAGAMRAGVRYLRHAPAVRNVLARCAAFIFGASALWALLPVLARRELGLGAVGYGLLLGCLGVGAIIGGALLGQVRARYSTDRIVGVSTVVYAGATLTLAWVRSVPVLGLTLVICGFAWMSGMSLFNVSTQRTSPDWARARMLSVYVLVYMGGIAIGAALWGTVAAAFGLRSALSAAAAAMLAGLLLTRRFRISAGEGLDLSPSGHWRVPESAAEVHPDAGPVLVTVEYRVPPDHADAFAAAMEEVGELRRRDGGISWGLYRDTSQPDRYIETFVSESWGEHMRQHARATMADRRTEARARAFHTGDTPPVVSHTIHVRTGGRRG
ncbi:MAG TPA: MFS transporter [Gemmatimonadales bacterium]|jgi:MFS family permease|nr:MFS transporter [Gemmatimonadales bacterium]